MSRRSSTFFDHMMLRRADDGHGLGIDAHGAGRRPDGKRPPGPGGREVNHEDQGSQYLDQSAHNLTLDWDDKVSSWT